MTYNPLIPPPTSSPNDSASPIQVNFSQFASIFSNGSTGAFYNHMPLNDDNQGKHAWVVMENQSSDPGAVGDLTVLFSKNATSNIDTQPQLFIQIPKFLPTNLDTTESTNAPMQLTYNSVGTTAPFYSFLPGGYLIYFGSTTSGTTITLIPQPSSVLCAIAVSTGVGSASNGGPTQTNVPYDGYVTVTQPDKVKVQSKRAPLGSTFYYIVIGKA